MLIVTLKEKEKVLVGNDISVMVVAIRGKQIRLAIQAPDDVLILREKLAKKGAASRSPLPAITLSSRFCWHQKSLEGYLFLQNLLHITLGW